MLALSTLTPELVDNLTASLSAADAVTLRAILPDVYNELRRVAAGFLRDERQDHTLQPTALVHEAYLRVADQRQNQWQNRAHLLGIFARMMRRILLDHASAHFAAKRGGKDVVRIQLDDALEVYSHNDVNLIELDEALRRLEKLDAAQAKIVEMRFFGGSTIEETAQALAISPMTVKREWSTAKRWLRRELSRSV